VSGGLEGFLALELSGEPATVALAAGGGILERRIPGERGRAVLAEVDALLRQAAFTKGALRAVLCGRGPGSYTGLRIAAATARSLGFALGIPAVGLPGFDAAAHAWFEENPEAEGLQLLQDAFRREFYLGRATPSPGGTPAVEINVVGGEELRERWEPRIPWLGDASVQDALPPGAPPPRAPLAPRARDLLRLAGALAARGRDPQDPRAFPPTPLYLRPALTRKRGQPS